MDLNLTVEKIEDILRADEAMPEKFTVLEASYSPELDVCFAKWIDDAEYDDWEDAMADGKSPDVARNIAAFKPLERYAGIWENDSPDGDGEKTYSSKILAGGELKDMVRNVRRLTPVCSV